MAEELLDRVRDALEGTIDFEGQRLAELLYLALISTVGVLSFVAGYATQNVYNSLYVGLAGTAVTFLIIVPPWPFYNKNPVQFLPSSKHGAMNITVDGKKIS